MSESLIFSFLVSDVSESLILLKSNERCEQIDQVAHQKWVTMSVSLRSLNKNERMSESLIFLSESLICSFLDKKRAICSEVKWANSQPCLNPTKMDALKKTFVPPYDRTCRLDGSVWNRP